MSERRLVGYWLPDKVPLKSRGDSIVIEVPFYAALYVLPKGALKKELLSSLRRGHKYRRHRNTGKQPIIECPIENMVLIDERPKEVEHQIVPGHWKGDLLIGKNRQSALGLLTERTTRTLFLVPLTSKSSSEVAR